MPRTRSRPHRMAKINQLLKVVRESHRTPMTGEHRQPELVCRDELGVTFIGHSSFLLQIAGRNLLIDPVFANRLVILRRARRAGVHSRDLPPIDVVLVTHAHMDHMNLPTLRRVARVTRALRGTAPVIVVPHGCDDLVAGLGFAEVITMKWWEQRVVAGLSVTMTPCKHWGARMFSDTHRHFGGYVIAGAGHSIYHSGDTAYFPGFLDLGASIMVPMHFGTFPLGREPMEEPPIRLMAEARRLHVEDKLRILAEGETLRLARTAPQSASVA